jgi:hypothetical protein
MKLSTVVGGLAGALILGACAATASARDIPSGGLTYEEVASWLRASGYPATIKPDTSEGAKSYERIVSSSVDGVNYDIYFYGCIKGRCDSIQYAAGWPSSRAHWIGSTAGIRPNATSAPIRPPAASTGPNTTSTSARAALTNSSTTP